MYYDFPLLPYTVAAGSRKNAKDRVDWPLRALKIDKAWKHTKGAGIKVAILDTGFSKIHPDLQRAVIGYKDFTGEGINDSEGHGTHVAGIVGARANQIGIVGVAPKCKLLIAKVLGKGGGQGPWITKAVKWAANQGADIISMSLGSTKPLRGLKGALHRLPKNIFIVAAVGNSGPKYGTVCYPARYDTVISVGAISKNQKVAKFSSRGSSVDVVAPGDNITSCYPKRALAVMSGTSMACPFVAGIMALALSKHKTNGGNTPINNKKDMLDHLIKSCTDLGKKGKDPNYGYGLVNPNKLLDG